MPYNKIFFEKVFSEKRMKRYFALYPNDESRALMHYKCNLRLSESMYVPISVIEVTLRNAICRELVVMTNREDWYGAFGRIPELQGLLRYIEQAKNQIESRHEEVTTPKVVAELTLGFWVSLFNSQYEKSLWKHLRRAFPYMPKNIRKRKAVSAPLNRIRSLRNRIFHNESICWNLTTVNQHHREMIELLGWMNKDMPEWLAEIDRVPAVSSEIINNLNMR